MPKNTSRAALRNANGDGLMILGDSLSINASHYRNSDWNNGETNLVASAKHH
ncbi:MAG: hypothetical protein U9N31_02335 [Candidatus Marinimicrobia bacterium]|nr:hypothetical protein [Candidatus Neomarinimicrobiota bacterium]